MNLTSFPEWQLLNDHHQQLSSAHLSTLFAQDSQRFSHFSLEAAGLFLDFSKNQITSQTLKLLVDFSKNAHLSEYIEQLFTGKPINYTEKRPALHTALRNPKDEAHYVDGLNITAEIKNALMRMEDLANKIYQETPLNGTAKPITDLVHIGIGGSHLGPRMVHEALSLYAHPKLRCHFVSSMDSFQIQKVLKVLNPQTTLFIIASKTFSTEETLINADRAKTWLRQTLTETEAAYHVIGVTANIQKAIDYGILQTHVFPLWDWVGGRYSIWSCMGIVVAACIGMERFRELLAGAHEMDMHFRHASFNENMPVILALLEFWYVQFFNVKTQAISPYNYFLRYFPRYLQQLIMESNGKQMQRHGKTLNYPTSPVIFGEVGTEGQHSFHQLLFQGTQIIPSDFIVVLNGPQKEKSSELLIHCLAQSRALMMGKSLEKAKNELLCKGLNPESADELAPHLFIPGNQPSNTILLRELTPKTLGALIALYEHKVFVASILWNINCFDQWGVELGKEIAKELRQDLEDSSYTEKYDSSTVGLINLK